MYGFQELKKKATAQILSLLHTAGKWSAFMRKTEYYKFKRLPDEGGNIRVSNPCFIRDKPDMLAQIESKYMSKDQVKEVKVKQVKPKKELKVTFEISRPTPKRPRPFEFSQDAIPLPHGWKMSKLGGEDSDWSAYLPKEI